MNNKCNRFLIPAQGANLKSVKATLIHGKNVVFQKLI